MTATRQRLVLLAALAIGLIAATVLTLRSGEGDDPDRVRGYLGPTPGPGRTAQSYIETKRRHLDRLARSEPTTQAAALISLTSYQPAPDVQARAIGLRPTVVFVRFPSSPAEPVLVTTTMAGAVADAANALRKQVEAEIRSLEARMTGAQPAARTEIGASIEQRRADLTKIRGDCGCVFAFAVEGAGLSKLRELQDKEGVRLVDLPDPLVNDLAGWELAPLVPPG